MQEAVRLGQRSTTELVDRYRLRDGNVRKVLIRYLDERRPGVDHNTFQNLVNVLAGVFWADIEAHHPDLDTLHLPSVVADAWKQRARTSVRADGATRDRGRLGYFQILDRVRAFYLDIQEWAMEDPTWAPWAAPSPVRRGDTDGYRNAHRDVVANMHQRVRDRLPQLPTLVRVVDDHRADQAALLAAANATPIGETLAHRDCGYRRVVPASYDKPEYRGVTPPVLVENLATGERINLTDTEDEAFWSWAIVETLRHTGVRVEELTELTHLALISYRLPDTGEIVPMLQIVPSKANQERLLLVGPELANGLAAIITRLRARNGGTIPLTARYDGHERSTGPALPHLFQRRRGSWRWSVIGSTTVRKLLIATLDRCYLAPDRERDRSVVRAAAGWPFVGLDDRGVYPRQFECEEPDAAGRVVDRVRGRAGDVVSVKVGYYWHLRRLMADAGMFATTDLVPLLAERGVTLSREQVYRLVAQRPERLSLTEPKPGCERAHRLRLDCAN